MPDLVGSSVKGSNTWYRFFVLAMLFICGIGVFAYTNGLADNSQPADFASARHVPTRSGTQVPPTPAFHGFASPLTSAYIVGETSYPNDGTSGVGDGLYVCAISVNASSLYCTHPDELHPLPNGFFAFSVTVPKGAYYVYSAMPDREYEAYYDSAADLSLVPVVVKDRQVARGITPVDWSQP